MARFGEYLIGEVFILIAAFSVVSKIAHSQQMAEWPFWGRSLAKGCGIISMVLFFGYMAAVVGYTAAKERTWSQHFTPFRETIRATITDLLWQHITVCPCPPLPPVEAAIVHLPTYQPYRVSQKKEVTKSVPPVVTEYPQPSAAPAIPRTESILIERGIEAVKNCRSFWDVSMKHIKSAEEDVKRHDSYPPDRTEESKRSFRDGRLGSAFREDMQLYTQVYRDSFMQVRRMLVVKVPEAAHGLIDYESPANLGGLTGICGELSILTEAYINKENSSGAVTVEDRRHYIDRLQER